MRKGEWWGPGLATSGCAAGPSCSRVWTAIPAVALAMAALVWAPAARAATHANDDCLMCHSDQGLKRSAPRPETSVFVDAASLAGSVHARLACTDCHKGIGELPHRETLAKPACKDCHAAEAKAIGGSVHAKATGNGGLAGCAGCHGIHDVRPAVRTGAQYCAKCHGEIVDRYQASVHGRALARGDSDASTCRDCHGGVHTVKSHLDPTAPVNRALLAATCAKCHADRALMMKRKIDIPAAVQLYRESVHGRSKDPNAATCSDCHESHDLRQASDPTSSIYRGNIPGTCGRCHTRELTAYRTGVHGQALARGVTRTPVCTDCHGEHRIQGPKDMASPVAGGGVTSTCSSCHEATGIRETYGLPAGRLSSYQDSFHGLAARGGSPVVANCSSCHGYHDILPSSDPRSMVNAKNLSQTCGRCHPGTGEEFARGLVHSTMARADQPLLAWIRLVYLWLIAGTIGGMAAHQGMDFVKKLRRRYADHVRGDTHAHPPSGRWFVRMTRSERIQHVLLFTSFFTLVYTGFALKYPENGLFAWLARMEHGYALRSIIHRVAAVVQVVTALGHIGYMFTKRGRGTLLDMVPSLRDAREAMENVLYLVGLRRTPPAFARFSYIEKAEYWALVWGTAVMTITGLILWFENDAGRVLGKWAFDAATLVHYYEAWLAFLAIVIWHLYQNILNPDVYPMNWTWVSGRISEEHLRHEHGGEWAEIMARERAESDDAPPPAHDTH
jgi:cytochrome b subunit of formate dehydrogenase